MGLLAWLKDLKARDDAHRERHSPNPASPFSTLLYPYRFWVALAFVVVIPVLIVVSVLW